MQHHAAVHISVTFGTVCHVSVAAGKSSHFSIALAVNADVVPIIALADLVIDPLVNIINSQFTILLPIVVLAPVAETDNSKGIEAAVLCNLIKLIEPLKVVDIAEPD